MHRRQQVCGGAELGDGVAQGEDPSLGLPCRHHVRLELATQGGKPGRGPLDLRWHAHLKKTDGSVYECCVAMRSVGGTTLGVSASAEGARWWAQRLAVR